MSDDTRCLLDCCCCAPKKCCICFDVKTGTTLIGLCQLFLFPFVMLTRSILLWDWYTLTLLVLPFFCFLVFLKLAKNDTS